MKFKYLSIFLLGASLTGLTACDDYLDIEPQSDITPAAFFNNADDLAAYTINMYESTFDYIARGSYGISTFGNDNHTDNQATVGYATRWVPGEWKVGTSNPWSWGNIRSINYFFDQVLPKFEAGKIGGSENYVKHYIGEAYVIRAKLYFGLLQNMGDAPIITKALPDVEEELIAASERMPRHKVARFILSDLDKAIDLLMENGPGGKNRVTKDVAYLLKSRVALYEGTWLKHHDGTAFVPGGPGWPGKDAQGYDMDTEVSFFLEQAMAAAKPVAEKLYANLVENTGAAEGMDATFKSLNPYYTMFCDTDMDKYSEVLMWREYIEAQGITHNIQMQLQDNGGGSGWTRGLVNSFVMENGYPIYHANSGYDAEWEKAGVKATLQNRDSRIQIFTKKDGDIDRYNADGSEVKFDMSFLLDDAQVRYVTGFGIKKGKHYNSYMQTAHDKGTTGSVVFRGTEALLNYIEASCEANDGKSIDDFAAKYWKALRKRAKIAEDYMITVNATDLAKEAEGDWGVYSKGQPVSELLYNVRRERRNELIGEGMRMADLKRWRALDQVKNYHVTGMRYWGSIYDGAFMVNGVDRCNTDAESGKANMSAESLGVYVIPNQINAVNNSVWNGYNWCEAHYLNPLAQNVFRQTATGDKTDLTTSNIYQNPGWPLINGESPIGY